MHLEPRQGSIPEPFHAVLSGPAPAPMPVASAWEWGALIAVALDGRPLTPTPSPRAVTDSPASRSADRAIVAVVGALAIAAVVLAALLM